MQTPSEELGQICCIVADQELADRADMTLEKVKEKA